MFNAYAKMDSLIAKHLTCSSVLEKKKTKFLPNFSKKQQVAQLRFRIMFMGGKGVKQDKDESI